MARGRRVWVAGIALIGIYVATAAAACAFQRSLMFPAPPARRVDSGAGEVLRIPGANGTTVFALHLRAPPGAPTIVHFHGNGEQLADLVPLATALHDAGVGVLAVEYPGYGMAARDRVSESSIYDAAEQALRYLHDVLGVAKNRTILEGQSLGTGVATEMALRGFGSRLVLVSPYTSMVDMASRVAPFLPVSLLVRDRFDTDEKAPRVHVPVLIVHGTADEVIPVSMAERLGTRFPTASVMLVPGGHHNDLWAADAPSLLARVVAFATGG